jgi:CcmD family protein
VIASVDHWNYILGAWAVTVVVIGGYAIALIRRGRRLSREVPPESRRWM